MPMLDRTASVGSEKAERRLRFSAGVELHQETCMKLFGLKQAYISQKREKS